MKKAWGSEPLIFLIIYVLLKDTYHIFLYLWYIYFYYYINAPICTELPVPCLKSFSNGQSVVASWKLEWWSSLRDLLIPIAFSIMQNVRKRLSLYWHPLLFVAEGSAQFTLIFLLALGIRSITDIMEHNSPETHEIVPVFYQMVTQVSRNVFLLMEWFSSSSKSPVCSASPQAEKHSALLLLVCFSNCIFQRKKH